MATTASITDTTATSGTKPKIKSRSRTVRSLRGGQMTIPIEFRRALGIDEETLLRVTLEDGALRVAPVLDEEKTAAINPLRALYEYFAPVREEVLARGISEEEVNADIDAAVAAVRAEQRARSGTQ